MKSGVITATIADPLKPLFATKHLNALHLNRGFGHNTRETTVKMQDQVLLQLVKSCEIAIMCKRVTLDTMTYLKICYTHTARNLQA